MFTFEIFCCDNARQINHLIVKPKIFITPNCFVNVVQLVKFMPPEILIGQCAMSEIFDATHKLLQLFHKVFDKDAFWKISTEQSCLHVI